MNKPCCILLIAEHPFSVLCKPIQIQGQNMIAPDIRAIIFDMDGVISDTAMLHYQSWQRLADEEGVQFSYEKYERMLGTTREENLRIFTEGLAVSDVTQQAWMTRKNGYFKEMAEQLTPEDALPGVNELLDQAEVAGLSVAVGSSSRNVHLVLGRLGLLDRFAVIGDGNSIVNSKPAPDIFLWVAGGLGISPQHVLVIEDSPKGVQAALTGGFYAVGVGKADLSAAHHHFDTLAGRTLDDLTGRLAVMA